MIESSTETSPLRPIVRWAGGKSIMVRKLRVFKFELGGRGRGRPPDSSKFWELLVHLINPHLTFWQLAKKLYPLEYARNPKRTADRTRRRVKSAQNQFAPTLQKRPDLKPRD